MTDIRSDLSHRAANHSAASPGSGFGQRLRQTLAAGLDLFAYPLTTSHYVELMNPLWTTHRMQARVVKVWDETKDARTLTLKAGANWRQHRAGQHVRVGLSVDGKHYTRTYTVSSAPERHDDCFTITVKAINGGRLSEHLVRRVQVGDYLPIGLPQGDFYLPDAAPIQPLFITAGSGITPIMSMLSSMVAQERMPNTVHIHYAPQPYDVIFAKTLRQMHEEQPHYQLYEQYTRLSSDNDAMAMAEVEHKDETDSTATDHLTSQAVGETSSQHLSLKTLEKFCPDWRERDCYVCGPADLLATVQAIWQRAGLTRKLHIERFRADFTAVPTATEHGDVTFSEAGVSTTADNQTPLLRVAEDAGLNPPHGCRMGICHTCNTTLRSGCVRDLRTGTIINDIGATVQTCVCAAAGDCELAM